VGELGEDADVEGGYGAEEGMSGDGLVGWTIELFGVWKSDRWHHCGMRYLVHVNDILLWYILQA
jgi:hypothetical protein